MGFSKQEYWRGLPRPIPGYLPDPAIELMSFTSPALAGGFFTTEPPGKSLPRGIVLSFLEKKKVETSLMAQW